MPEFQQQQLENQTDYSADYEYNNHSSSQPPILMVARSQIHFYYYSAFDVSYLDLRAVQTMYFPKLSDFGRPDLSPVHTTDSGITERELETAEILANMSDDKRANDYPDKLFSNRKRAHSKVLTTIEDDSDEDYVPTKDNTSS